MQEQQAEDRVTSALFVSLPFYHSITVCIAPHLHGNPVRDDPIPTVFPVYSVNLVTIIAVSPQLPRYSRRPHYRADLYTEVLHTRWWVESNGSSTLMESFQCLTMPCVSR